MDHDLRLLNQRIIFKPFSTHKTKSASKEGRLSTSAGPLAPRRKELRKATASWGPVVSFKGRTMDGGVFWAQNVRRNTDSDVP